MTKNFAKDDDEACSQDGNKEIVNIELPLKNNNSREMVVIYSYFFLYNIVYFIILSMNIFFYVFPNKLLMREVNVRVLAPNPSVLALSSPECLEPLLLVVSIPEEAEDSAEL